MLLLGAMSAMLGPLILVNSHLSCQTVGLYFRVSASILFQRSRFYVFTGMHPSSQDEPGDSSGVCKAWQAYHMAAVLTQVGFTRAHNHSPPRPNRFAIAKATLLGLGRVEDE